MKLFDIVLVLAASNVKRTLGKKRTNKICILDMEYIYLCLEFIAIWLRYLAISFDYLAK